MKVGDYVRTEKGIIGKLEKEQRTGYGDWIIDTLYYNDDEIINCLTCSIANYDIIKSSPNIIDLIEEHDILKIEEQKGIYTICEVEEFRDPYVNYKFLGARLENQSRARKLYELNIKSIVTREMFESMEYRIGE